MSFIEIKAKGVPAKTHYSINAEKLISEIHNISSVKSTKLKKRNQQNCNSEINETITENTTENTTKNTSYILSENSKEFSPIEINGILFNLYLNYKKKKQKKVAQKKIKKRSRIQPTKHSPFSVKRLKDYQERIILRIKTAIT
jgi:folate-dependent tRNA-U54 methylase TrmFO/GidA